jgi:hypothetical protein
MKTTAPTPVIANKTTAITASSGFLPLGAAFLSAKVFAANGSTIAPHLLQKLLPVFISFPQLLQSIVFPSPNTFAAHSICL